MLEQVEAFGMELHGIFVPLITPFAPDGAVALDVLERLAHQVLDDGAAGLVALGTTGEPGSLSAAEQEAVVDVTVRVARERGVPLIVGARPDLAARPGVTAALSLVPPFVRPGEAGVVAHFEALAGDVPLVIYHVPYRTGQELSITSIRRLAAIPGVVGMKYTTGTVEVIDELPPGFSLLGGDDPLISPMLAIGAHGGILASAHVATRSFVEMAAAWRDGDVQRARSLGGRLAELSRALFAEPNPTVIKGMLCAQGRIPTASVRLPLLPATRESVDAALAGGEAADLVGHHAQEGGQRR
ncbi:4-hydroxy-tetrahydrodipicolinate synthase [Actinoplanes xinjiangensis]|uniref:4-hydroxy-tetrahydrodipicolinate synthase n=2 Tax=Actinoplanes xinjiangensis TaxID=512350 RepID=A0A316FIB8_9ACTN|nr:4-hydroxy-tetrahydrodipicolinate synthase [Actinoplanes xinjiangensis]GIF39523.1 4-hydroxy-tetrahydrodipicolinate synthase [Actinoplanes xinjiangensis]